MGAAAANSGEVVIDDVEGRIIVNQLGTGTGKKTLSCIKKTANLSPLKPQERIIPVNSYFDPERNCTKPLLYALCRKMKA